MVSASGAFRRWVARWVRRGAAPLLDRTPPPVLVRVLPVVRKLRAIQISAAALGLVRAEVTAGSTLLVFGVGHDSRTWELINRHGETAFVEDVPEWLDRSLRESPDRAAHLVSYGTTVESSLDYSDASQIPMPPLPDSISSRRWDVVVVDGPRGDLPGTPGRASSIALAERLVADGGLVLVDDYERPLETHVCAIVFGRPADEVVDPSRPVGVYRCSRRKEGGM